VRGKSLENARLTVAVLPGVRARYQYGRQRPGGAWLDRDINAAVNVAKAAGLAVTACRAQVRPDLVPAQRVEAGTHPKSHPDAVWQTGIAALQLQGGVEVNARRKPRSTAWAIIARA